MKNNHGSPIMILSGEEGIFVELIWLECHLQI